jgi:hypothetical protein
MFEKIFGSRKPNDPELFTAKMPEVDTPPTIDSVFHDAREGGAKTGDSANRHVVVITPGRMLFFQPCPEPGSIDPAQVANIEKMIPPNVKRNIAVIAYTELRAIQTDITKAIPFIGMLIGLASIGHSVWIFEGHASAIPAGCKDADVLLVDGEMIPHLAKDWVTLAAKSMRRPEIYSHDRTTFSLRKVDAQTR